MKLLLDTHTFLWWDREPARLSVRAREAIRRPGAELFLSLASVWEMQIKVSNGKLDLRIPLKGVIAEQQSTNGLQLLSVRPEHVWRLAGLPRLHRDPFDRMLVAQAIEEGMRLVSNDPDIAQYRIGTFW